MVLYVVLMISYATIVPLTKNATDEALGPFTPEAEMINGRAAMIGLAFLLLSEGVTGRVFF